MINMRRNQGVIAMDAHLSFANTICVFAESFSKILEVFVVRIASEWRLLGSKAGEVPGILFRKGRFNARAWSFV